MTSAVWWIVGLVAVAFVVGAVAWWQEKRRRTPRQAAEHAAIRALWRLARRMPASQVLHDRVTEQYFLILRNHMFLDVLVSDIDLTLLEVPAGAVVTTYSIGGEGRPNLGPILRQQHPAELKVQRDQTLRQAKEVLEFNERTGAMNASLEDLLLLHEQLERVLRER